MDSTENTKDFDKLIEMLEQVDNAVKFLELVPNLDTITEQMFEAGNYKCFYTIQTSTFTYPAFTALLTIQYKGVNVSQWGATTNAQNKLIISFFKNKYSESWSNRSKNEKAVKAEFENLKNK